MGQAIRIVGDQPAEIPRLGFEHYAHAIAGAVQGGQPAQFTIGLYGPWGSGKSSLLQAVGRELETSAPECIVVEFDAWRYQPGGEMVSTMLVVISEALAKHQKLRTLARRLKSYALATVRGTKVNIGVDPSVEFSAEPLADALDGYPSFPEASHPSIVAAMRADAKTLGSNRVVVLVDDLDRCSPANLVAVLETINNVMDINGFVFVLALDYEVLVQAILREYPHVSGHEFIEKMVQVPFRVPPLDLEDKNLLRDLFPNWLSLVSATSEGFGDALLRVVRVALRGNPRQTKRLVNSFLVLRNIVQARGGVVDDVLLVTVLGIQFGWPEEYSGIQQSLVLDRPESVKDFLASFDEERISPIAALLRHALAEDDDLTTLVSAIHLAAAASPQRESEREDVTLRNFENFLTENGWEPSQQLDEAWHPNQSIADWHTVRIVKRGSRLALEMREFSSTPSGRRPVFQTITHVPVRDAVSLSNVVIQLTEGRGSVQTWRKAKLTKRGNSAQPTPSASRRQRSGSRA